jgi:hypothetical protein
MWQPISSIVKVRPRPYRAVHDSLRRLGESWISSSQIKVIGPGHPIAQEILAVMRRHPGRSATRFGGDRLGSVTIDHAYIYPAQFFSMTRPNQMSIEEIGREIIRLMNRGPAILTPSRVTLKDGTGFDGVPISLQYGSQNTLVVQFIADQEAAPRVYRIDEIASIV